ncbi:Extradiol ring-cleavage dioxygenase, class III enzyme, subunit B, partial [Suillus subalutaceus]|uniref:Extradiol ring-cleavage dioxygenase, class III enzyme, subunit B n=1 Tax=Suillus subalutaceus TaxID=48586 RepID=UPI001B87EB52
YESPSTLLMDYFGFETYYYRQTFDSKGDHTLVERVVQLRQDKKLSSLTFACPRRSRELDGQTSPPQLNHGVFVPSKLMFWDENDSLTPSDDMPIVQVSIERSDDPEQNWAVEKVLSKFCEEGNFVLAGGLTIH